MELTGHVMWTLLEMVALWASGKTGFCIPPSFPTYCTEDYDCFSDLRISTLLLSTKQPVPWTKGIILPALRI